MGSDVKLAALDVREAAPDLTDVAKLWIADDPLVLLLLEVDWLISFPPLLID